MHRNIIMLRDQSCIADRAGANARLNVYFLVPQVPTIFIYIPLCICVRWQGPGTRLKRILITSKKVGRERATEIHKTNTLNIYVQPTSCSYKHWHTYRNLISRPWGRVRRRKYEQKKKIRVKTDKIRAVKRQVANARPKLQTNLLQVAYNTLKW